MDCHLIIAPLIPKSELLVLDSHLANDREDFERFIEPLLEGLSFFALRVLMTAGTFTVPCSGDPKQTGQGRTLYQLLEYYGFMQYPEIDALAKRSLQKEN